MSNSPYIGYCPIGCDAPLVEIEIVLPEGPLRKCSRCGQLVSWCSEERYFESLRMFDEPEGTMPEGKAAARLQQQTGRLLARVERMTGLDRRKMRLLDVGCSSGSFLASAAAHGVRGEGVEPAPEPVRAAVAAGLQVHQGLLEEMGLPPLSYDLVTLFEVIEHLPRPIPLLQECHRLLKPGGVMVIRTGNTNSWSARYKKNRWFYFHIQYHGGHVSFFNPSSMRLLARRCGFVVEDMMTHSVVFYEKQELPFIPYRLMKICSELLNAPAKVCGKGHEMVVYLRKPNEERSG